MIYLYFYRLYLNYIYEPIVYFILTFKTECRRLELINDAISKSSSSTKKICP